MDDVVPRHGTDDVIADFLLDRLAAGGPIRIPIALVVAHPDDEVIGAGATMTRMLDLTLIHVTDGAPSDPALLRVTGFEGRHEYSAARFLELDNALSAAAVHPTRRVRYEIEDGRISRSIGTVAERLFADLMSVDAVLTHAYEGGHTDHDACARAVYLAQTWLRQMARRAPAVLEFAGYYHAHGDVRTGVFQPNPHTREVALALHPSAIRRREAAFSCFASQRGNLEYFSLRSERFRKRPDYGFEEVPFRLLQRRERQSANETEVRVDDALRPVPGWATELAPPPDREDRPISEILDNLGDDPAMLAEEGIALREAGSLAGAEEIFDAVIARFPDLVYGWQELGILKSKVGEYEAAIKLFERCVVVDPEDPLVRARLAMQLARVGRYDDALATLDPSAGAAHYDTWNAQALAEFVSFARCYPEKHALEMVEAIEMGSQYLKPSAVQDRILTAIAERAPFTLVRLGDGEGAWLRLDDEELYPTLYEVNRRDFLGIWFGQRSPDLTRFQKVGPRFDEAIAKADVVGIPYGLRIAHEYRVFSPRGIPSCVNILRRFTERRDDAAFCTNDIHLVLHNNGFFDALLAKPLRFGVVTCHPSLGSRLMRAFGTAVCRSILVPEEQSFYQIAGVSGMPDPHFPRTYQRTIAKLRQQASDADIWLVAAGYLGKIYCDVVREVGGVALDVGSIADGWVGKVTRPTLRAIANFEL